MPPSEDPAPTPPPAQTAPATEPETPVVATPLEIAPPENEPLPAPQESTEELPVIETPSAPEPAAGPPSEPQVEEVAPAPAPERVAEPEKDIAEPEPTPPVAPTEVNGIPQKVLDLTPQELDAARRLWAKEHIKQAQRIANEHRHARMVELMSGIESFVKKHPESTTHAIANHMQLSEKLTSGYLQKLVHAGRIRGVGNTGNRRYTK